MAKLSHPNVGVVHDVGVWSPGADDESVVWIAIELIEGEDVRRWCRRAAPTAREILDAYLQLGRGLAAAHDAGLVHRDVKPDNAMRDREGRVRVLDFGLAHSAASDGPQPAPDLRALAGLDLESFTQTGVIVGTPAYMAPEQFDGLAADARSDQYAFCVALFEALWGMRPHAGESVVQIAEARRSGRVLQPPRRRDVPSGVRTVLLRGLDPSPAARWPSMGALLDALERARRSRAPLWLGAGVIATAAAAIVATRQPEACAQTDAAVAGVWDDDVRARVRDGFARDDRAFVPALAASVSADIDAYVDELRAAYKDACVATHDTQVQSRDVLDVQTACLDVRRTRLRALLDVFAAADAEVVERATAAVEGLEPVASCLDRTALLAVAPPDPSIASAVADAEGVLASAASSRSAGRFDEAATFAERALGAATATAYAPLVARARIELARVHTELGHEAEAVAHATEAHFLATATSQHALAADAAALATESLPAESASRAVAALWHRAGFGAADSQDDGERARADVDIALGTFLLQLQSPDAAVPLARGIEVLRRRLGPDAADVSRAELMYAYALVLAGRTTEARELADRIRTQADAQLGENPPRLAKVLGSLSEVYQFSGAMTESLEVGTRALELAIANLGEEHHVTNDTRVNVATLHLRSGEKERAVELLTRTVTALDRRGDGPRLARARHALAIALKSLKRWDEALVAETASVQWYREHTPDEPRQLVNGQLTLGNIQLLRDHNREAEVAYLAAIELVEQHRIVDREVPACSDYANFLFQTGRAAEAVVKWEELLARMKAKGEPRYELAQYELDLARALWREGKRERAREVAAEVLHVLRTEPPTPQVGGHLRRDWTPEDVESWLEDPDAWETN
jgi:tetratricopeptide (TPR) repeat protein